MHTPGYDLLSQYPFSHIQANQHIAMAMICTQYPFSHTGKPAHNYGHCLITCTCHQHSPELGRGWLLSNVAICANVIEDSYATWQTCYTLHSFNRQGHVNEWIADGVSTWLLNKSFNTSLAMSLRQTLKNDISQKSLLFYMVRLGAREVEDRIIPSNSPGGLSHIRLLHSPIAVRTLQGTHLPSTTSVYHPPG